MLECRVSLEFYLQEVWYSVPLTIHLPDFSMDVVEAFLRSLDGGMTTVSQKQLSLLLQLQLVLGIKEAKGSCFPSFYRVERTEVESSDFQEEEEVVDFTGDITECYGLYSSAMAFN